MEVTELLLSHVEISGYHFISCMLLVITGRLICVAVSMLVFWGIMEYLIWRVGKELNRRRRDTEGLK